MKKITSVTLALLLTCLVSHGQLRDKISTELLDCTNNNTITQYSEESKTYVTDSFEEIYGEDKELCFYYFENDHTSQILDYQLQFEGEVPAKLSQFKLLKINNFTKETIDPLTNKSTKKLSTIITFEDTSSDDEVSTNSAVSPAFVYIVTLELDGTHARKDISNSSKVYIDINYASLKSFDYKELRAEDVEKENAYGIHD